MDLNRVNVLVLAYVGDALYEIYIREYLVLKGINKVKELQEEAIKYVSAKGQSKLLNKLTDDNYLTEDELDIVKRARNSKVTSHPKNIDILTYKHATAFEALIGYLYLGNNKIRIDQIINYIIGDD